MKRELTGKHVLIIAIAFFGVIIGVNVFMAYRAISTFPGLEVKSSYVSSQTWDAEQKAQKALGWKLATHYDEATSKLRLTFTDRDGLPAEVQDLTILVGRTTSAAQDQTPPLQREAGVYVADAKLGAGKWMMQVNGRASDGTIWQGRVSIYVKG